uniref:Uncharacterized protein n=1 Tax=Petromyzon marinus TaxID=7757 RepID=S4RDL2_PETMA
MVLSGGDDSPLEVSSGTALIINMVHFMSSLELQDREGSQRDEQLMTRLLGKIGFEVDLLLDKTSDNIMKALQEGVAENRKNAEAFVCVILSHGWHGHFMCCDGTKVHYKDIYSLFNNKAWEHKLKLFIIQACRGDSTDSGAKLEEGENCEQTQESGNRDDASSSLDEACILNDDLFAPPETLTFFSTPEGYVSYRPKLSSCQFIEFVREELTRAWEQRVELVQSLTRVSRRIARDFQSNSKKEQYNGKKQMPCLVSHLTRDVYLVQRQSY